MDRVLEAQLRNHLMDIDALMSSMREVADSEGISLSLMRYSDGKWVIADILVAKAQCLNALAYLSGK